MKPKLRCRVSSLPKLAARYDYQGEDAELRGMQQAILERGYMRKDGLRIVARWKARRSAGRMEANTEDYTREITQYAFSTTTKRARIEILTLLSGVGWPSASVLLHFFHCDPYPIIDYRALWTVSMGVPSQYDFDFWWQYVVFCRELAARCGLGMRMLDRALWQYSRENQVPS